MAPDLPGVRIGPLDPDRADQMGQVGGQAGGGVTARTLIRHWTAMNPPALTAALSRQRQDERSKAIVREEAEAAVRRHYEDVGEALPEDAVITGFNVRGEEDKPEQQVLTFTYALPSGRSGKGFVPYSDEYVSASREAGDDAVKIAKLKEAGLPWEPRAVRQVEGDRFARDVAGRRRGGRDDERDEDERDDGDADELREENEELRDENAALRERLREVEGQRESVEQSTVGGGSGVASSPQNPEGGSPDLAGTQGEGGSEEGDGDGDSTPGEPFDGYDDLNAPDLRKRIAESDRDEAERIAAYERANQNRSTVVAAAEQRVDRAGNGS